MEVDVSYFADGGWTPIGTVPRGEAVSFGNERTQIVVPTNEWLPPVCVTLVVTSDECVIADVSEVDGLCDLNGQWFQRANLKTGDVLRIGPAHFTFEVSEVTASGPDAIQDSPMEATEGVADAQLWTRLVGESGHCFEPLEPGVALPAVVRELSTWASPVLLANFRGAGLPLPGGISPDEDHYSGAPNEIRALHSLHSLQGTIDDLLAHYAPMHDSDAAVWGFCDKNTSSWEDVL